MIRFTSINRLIMTPVLAIIAVLVLLNAGSLTIAFSLMSDIEQVEQTNVMHERLVSEALTVNRMENQMLQNTNVTNFCYTSWVLYCIERLSAQCRNHRHHIF